MKTLKLIIVGIVLFTGVSGDAQTWTGTWNSTFGELRLQQIGNKVYGDYRDLGDIEGTINGNKLTGTFTNGSNTGNFEWTRSNNNAAFTGKWKWSTSNTWETWDGTLKSSLVPVLTSNLAIDKKRNHLNGLAGSQNYLVKFNYASFGDTKSNPNEFSIFGLASSNLFNVKRGNRTRFTMGPRIMNTNEDRAEKTRRTASGVKLINFNRDFNISIPNSVFFDPENSFEVEVTTHFRSKGIFSNGDFGKKDFVINLTAASPTETYTVKSSKGNLISNLFFTIRKTN